MRPIAIVLLCTGLLLGQGSRSVERAWKLAASGQRDQAVELLQQLVKTNPRDADARLLLGSLLMEAERGAEAIAELNAAVRLRPRSAEAQNALGEAYSSVGDLKAAREAFQEAVAIKPDLGIAQMNLGEALLGIGQLNLAAEHLERALRLLGRTDDAASAHYLRAKAYTARNDVQDAAEQLQLAVNIRPNFAQAWSDLGEAQKTLLDDTRATAALERAVALAPGDPIAQYRLGAEYLDADKPDLAAEHLEAAYRLNPEDQSTLNALQRALRQEGKTKEADEIKEKLSGLLRKKDEQNQNALAATNLNNEGASLQKAGDLQGALGRYRTAVGLAPENVAMRVNYAIALLRLGQWTDGLNELHTAAQMNPGDPKIQEALREAIAQAPAGLVPDWKQR